MQLPTRLENACYEWNWF